MDRLVLACRSQQVLPEDVAMSFHLEQHERCCTDPDGFALNRCERRLPLAPDKDPVARSEIIQEHAAILTKHNLGVSPRDSFLAQHQIALGCAPDHGMWACFDETADGGVPSHDHKDARLDVGY